MKYIIFQFLLAIAFQACIAQNKTTPCKDTFEVDIDNTGLYENASLIKVSMQKKLEIVFEMDFNDSIYIYCGTKIIQHKKIETNKPLGVSRETVKIDYSNYKDTPRISIFLKKKNDCISFFPKRGKRMAYINHINGAWSVELSNIIREYR